MKLILIIILLISFSKAAYEEHTFTMGIANTPYDFDNDAFDIEYGSYENLNYRGEGSIDIGILYTTKHLKTVTVY